MRNGLLLLLLLTVDGVWHNNDIIVRRTICTLTILISHPFHPQGGGGGWLINNSNDKLHCDLWRALLNSMMFKFIVMTKRWSIHRTKCSSSF